jgi:hypothetical protein
MKLLCTVVGLATLMASVSGASLQRVTSFGANPTTIDMFIYVPEKLATKPPIIVAVSCDPSPTRGAVLKNSSTAVTPVCVRLAADLYLSYSFTPAVAPPRSGTGELSCHPMRIRAVLSSSIPKRPTTATAGMSRTPDR